jgi:hypothetical protein
VVLLRKSNPQIRNLQTAVELHVIGNRMKLKYVLSIAFSLAMFPFGVIAATEGEALNFVEKLKLGNNLSIMAFQIGKNTQTYRMLESQLGSTEASKLFSEEVIAAAPHFQTEWNANLAKSYAEAFSSEELNSLMLEKEKSPSFNKMQTSQPTIGASMQKRSEKIPSLLVAEALEKAFTKTVKIKK